MKISIDKLQTGGRMFFSAVADPSSPFNQLAADASLSASSSSSDGLLSKETMNKLNEGLPNEVEFLNNIIAELETKIDQGYPINRQELANLRSLANRVILQSDYLKRAEEFVKENRSRDDIAVDQNGYIYAFDSKGKMKKVSFKEFDAQKYQAVTIGELIEYRRNDPNAVNNSDIIKTIGNSIGLESINDFILKILKDVGKADSKEEAYDTLRIALGKDDIKQLSNADYAAIKALSEASDQIGMDLLFKITTTTSNSNVAQAAQYLISILPKNMQMQLQGTAIAQGRDKTRNYAAELIQMASEASNKSTYNYEITPVTNPSDKSGTGGTGGKSFYQTPNEILFDMDLNQIEVGITDYAFDNLTEIKVKGTKIPGLTSDNGNSKYNLPLGLALNETIGKYLDYSKIFMGEQKISEGLLNDIAYSRDLVAVVWMPIDNKNNIDWAGLHGYSVAEKEIEERHITAIDDKNKIHKKYNSFAEYNENDELVPITLTDRFMMTYGYTIDNLVDNDNKFAYELTGETEDEIDNLIGTIYNKKLKQSTGISKISGKHKHDDIYRIPIFIKVDKNAQFDAYSYGGHGSLLPGQSLQQTQILQESLQPILNRDQMVYGSTPALFLQ